MAIINGVKSIMNGMANDLGASVSVISAAWTNYRSVART